MFIWLVHLCIWQKLGLLSFLNQSINQKRKYKRWIFHFCPAFLNTFNLICNNIVLVQKNQIKSIEGIQKNKAIHLKYFLYFLIDWLIDWLIDLKEESTLSFCQIHKFDTPIHLSKFTKKYFDSQKSVWQPIHVHLFVNFQVF